MSNGQGGVAMEGLERRIRECTLCRLHESRKNAVPGEGPYDAKVVLVGEGPGRNEDLNGVPFCGAAGRFLDELLKMAGLNRPEVYITNTVKCKPPLNRVPKDDEIEICTTNYLKRQIAMIRPKLVVVMGRTSAKALLGREVVMGVERGKLMRHEYGGVKFQMFVTYHPAASLYGAQAKLKLKEDFSKLSQVLKSI